MRRLTLATAAVLGLTACAPARGAATSLPLTGHRGPAGSASWAPWPQASHDARRSGASDAVGPRTGAVRWTRRLEGDVTPGPVIGIGGTVYAASNAGVLHALDPATGADRWTYAPGGGYGGDLSTSPAALPDGTVLWSGPGGVHLLSSSGALLWRVPLLSATSPAVDGDRVLVGSQSGSVVALDLRHRRVLWRTDLGSSGYGSVALSPTDPHRAYTTAGEDLVALDDDRVAWRAPLGAQAEVSPAVSPEGTVVVGSNSPYQRGFSPAGKEVWRVDRHAETYSSPIVTDDGLAYFGDHRAVVTAVDVRTGEVAARYPGPTRRPRDGRSVGVWTAPVVDAEHAVYWGSRSGHLHAVDRDGHELFDLDTGATVDSYPALGDGVLVVGVTDGRLLAIGAAA